MLTFERLESIFHALCNFLPYLIIIVYTFKDKLRFSKKVTAIIIFLLTLFEVTMDELMAVTLNLYASILSVINTAVYVAICFVLIKDNWRKTFFTLIVISSIANNIMGLTAFFDHLLDKYILHIYHSNLNHWSLSLTMIVVQAIVLIPMSRYIKKYFVPIVNISQKKLWRFLWLIPAFFYFTWYFVIYIAPSCSSLEMAERPSTAVFMVIEIIGSIAIYHLIIRLVTDQYDMLAQQESIYIYERQVRQYKRIEQSINEARIARHDAKHHIAIIQNYLKQDKYDELKEYVDSYAKSIDLDSQLVYCKDYNANLIIGYYAEQAKQFHININTNIEINGEIPMDKIDLTSLLGNMLENAVDAAKLTAERLITLTITKQNNNVITFYCKNSSNTPKLQKVDEAYKSSKHEGNGTGLTSIKRVVDKYNGSLKIEQDDNEFTIMTIVYTNN